MIESHELRDMINSVNKLLETCKEVLGYRELNGMILISAQQNLISEYIYLPLFINNS